MKERPIPFAGEMVRAILAGKKTQTRRVIKPQPELGKLWKFWVIDPNEMDLPVVFCQYGIPGDRLWVQETLRRSHKGPVSFATYAVDLSPVTGVGAPELYRGQATWRWQRSVLPSIFMPRWAGRIRLEIVQVRSERLQDISKKDAIAEGIYWSNAFPEGYTIGQEIPGYGTAFGAAETCFRALWDNLNAKRGYGWDTNPWVWVIEFKRVADKGRLQKLS